MFWLTQIAKLQGEKEANKWSNQMCLQTEQMRLRKGRESEQMLQREERESEQVRLEAVHMSRREERVKGLVGLAKEKNVFLM